MTPEEVKSYILEHHKEMTRKELSDACCTSESRIGQHLAALGVRPVTETQMSIERKVAVIRANPEKNTQELAKMLQMTSSGIFYLCKTYNLPHVLGNPGGCNLGFRKDDPRTWSPEIRQRELNNYLRPLMQKGYTRDQALTILEETADTLIRLADEDPRKKKPTVRPKAVYNNVTREQLVERILNQLK